MVRIILRLFKKQILREIEDVLGYCGTWSDKDILSCEWPSGNKVSMSVKTFKNSFLD